MFYVYVCLELLLTHCLCMYALSFCWHVCLWRQRGVCSPVLWTSKGWRTTDWMYSAEGRHGTV